MDLSESVDRIMSSNVISHSRQTPLQKIVEDMTERNVSTILLLDDGKISGIITERDLVQRVLKEDRPISELSAQDIMTPAPLISIQPGRSIKDVIEIMKSHHIKSVPIVIPTEDSPSGDCTGLITQTDVIRSIAI